MIQEAAIIFENGLHDFYDKVILVTAPNKIRLKRVMDRDKVSETDVLARMKNQWEDEEKIKLSDYVIDNLNLEDTITKVGEVHKLLLAYT